MKFEKELYSRADLVSLTGLCYNSCCKLYKEIYSTIKKPKRIHKRQLPVDYVKSYYLSEDSKK